MNSPNQINKIRSSYFVNKLFSFLPEKKMLNMVKYNMHIQRKIEVDLDNYKLFGH